jgi:GTP cyclohydrolase III
MNEAYMQIIKFSVIIVVLIHSMGCIWYFLGSFYPGENWISAFGIEDEGIFRKYIASIYFIMTILVTVGYGNVVPTNTLEYVFVNLFMLVAVMIYSYIMGILTF